jgi:hypothetical protein
MSSATISNNTHSILPANQHESSLEDSSTKAEELWIPEDILKNIFHHLPGKLHFLAPVCRLWKQTITDYFTPKWKPQDLGIVSIEKTFHFADIANEPSSDARIRIFIRKNSSPNTYTVPVHAIVPVPEIKKPLPEFFEDIRVLHAEDRKDVIAAAHAMHTIIWRSSIKGSAYKPSGQAFAIAKTLEEVPTTLSDALETLWQTRTWMSHAYKYSLSRDNGGVIIPSDALPKGAKPLTFEEATTIYITPELTKIAQRLDQIAGALISLQ